MTTSEEQRLAFVKIFLFEKRRELGRYCRDLVVSDLVLADFILACETGIVPFKHHIHYQDHVPAHLRPSRDELAALTANGVGPLTGDGLKAARKIGQTFVQRRYLVGHLFLTPDPSRWHFLYLDQRDIAESDNHWKEGPHLHFVNWLWLNLDAQSIWKEFRAGQPPKAALHIRFRFRRTHQDPVDDGDEP
jgi:hypothetical protein